MAFTAMEYKQQAAAEILCRLIRANRDKKSIACVLGEIYADYNLRTDPLSGLPCSELDYIYSVVAYKREYERSCE